jgi:uncharacterized membrane protein
MLSTRLALLEFAARRHLDAATFASLAQLAGIQAQPQQLLARLQRGLALLAAALGGLGIIFWVAANWNTFGRPVQFGLLQVFILVMCAAAALRPAARPALSLLALLGIGALFAAMGQAYQTGADPWQLFALWAALALPLALATRADVVWAAWAAVAMSAISLWSYSASRMFWDHDPAAFFAAAAAVALALLLSRRFARFTGAGPWAFGMALVLALGLMTVAGGEALLTGQAKLYYGPAVLVLGLVAWTFTTPALFDMFSLSVSALALNFLLICGLARLLLDGPNILTVTYLVVAVSAAGLLTLTLKAIQYVARLHAANGEQA